jgi:hypothetical protein
MNAGLSNLFTLKSWLLPEAMVAGTDYDVLIATIGKGVAAALEQHCNRRFLRIEGDVFECAADRMHIGLPRFPLEVLTTIEQRDTLSEGWVAKVINDFVENQANDSGLVWFTSIAGTYPSRLRFTYTGGYWFDLLEPADMGFPTTQPAGSTAVPPDLLAAWLLLCENIWKTHDKLGLSIGEKAGAGGGSLLGLSLAGLDIPPIVQAKLQPFIRFSLTT